MKHLTSENDVICIGIKKRAMIKKHLIKRGVKLPTDEAELNKLIDKYNELRIKTLERLHM